MSKGCTQLDNTKVFSKLLGLQYKIIYKQGVENKMVDALSRTIHSSSELNVVSSVTPTWVQLVMDTYSNDATAKELLANLALSPYALPDYTLNDGLIR
jgi:hypothetical protein